MRSILATGLLAAILAAGLGGAARAADEKKAAAAADKPLYVSREEAGNKMFFTMSGWHGTRNYWMAGAYQHPSKKSARKAEPKKK